MEMMLQHKGVQNALPGARTKRLHNNQSTHHRDCLLYKRFSFQTSHTSGLK